MEVEYSAREGVRRIGDRLPYYSLLSDYQSSGRRKRIFIIFIIVVFFLILLGFLGYMTYYYFFEHKATILSRQSPINILSEQSQFDSNIENAAFLVSYHEDDVDRMINTGHGWKIILKADGTNSTIRATHLPGLYKLFQVHAHWGESSLNGSEHLVDDIGYAAELHFVHYNAKYRSFTEAMKYAGGLAVLAVFLEEKNDSPVDFSIQTVANWARNIIYKDDFININGALELASLLPSNKEFWVYDGSLTTPPYSETVIWTVFKNPLYITEQQIKSFRLIQPCPKEAEDRNSTTYGQDACMRSQFNLVRPIQPLNGRIVRSSFENYKLASRTAPKAEA